MSAPAFPNAPPILGVTKIFPSPKVSVAVPLELAVAVPTPKYASSPLCAWAKVPLNRRTEINGKAVRMNFTTDVLLGFL